jgi:hypothetical protein
MNLDRQKAGTRSGSFRCITARRQVKLSYSIRQVPVVRPGPADSR